MAKTEPNWPAELERAMQQDLNQGAASAIPWKEADPYAPKPVRMQARDGGSLGRGVGAEVVYDDGTTRRLADLQALERDISTSPPPDDQPDALIRGLLTHLPRPGDVWPETKRKLWLELVAGSFKLIYEDAPQAESAP